MSKKSTITNLLVIPLIGSAILLANPVLAANTSHPTHSVVRHKTNIENPKRQISGIVTSINGNIIVVTTKDNVQYTVDASNANIMKASTVPNENPSIIAIGDIKVGDSIVVRGEINSSEISADNIFDGILEHKHPKHGREHRHTENKSFGFKKF